jgi:hypothetical protein
LRSPLLFQTHYDNSDSEQKLEGKTEKVLQPFLLKGREKPLLEIWLCSSRVKQVKAELLDRSGNC